MPGRITTGIYTGLSKSLCAPDNYSKKKHAKIQYFKQNTFGMWTVLYWTRSSRKQFGVSINVWRLAVDTLNITCNFLCCNLQVHRDFLITLYIYTGCHRRNGQNFGRVFLMLNYTDITQNPYVQSWTVSEIMANKVWNFDSCYKLTDYQIHIETGRNMWFL